MTIVASTLPRSAVSVVERALVDGLARSAFTLPNLAKAPRASLFLAFPHRVAHLPLDVIRPYADLREVAVDAGWRFLVQQRRQRDAGAREEFVPIASVTVTETKGGAFKIGEFNEGPFVAGTEAAVRHAETLDVVRKGQFEAVLLLVPAVHIVALWLQGKVGDEDILIPIPPSDAALAPMQPMTPPAFLAVLHKLAQRILRVDSRAP